MTKMRTNGNLPSVCDKDTFILSARNIYNDKYCYRDVKYVNTHTEVSVTCPKHGIFHVTPDRHLHRSRECPQCKPWFIKGEGISYTQKEYIQRCLEKHENNYDYSCTEYIHSKQTVNIRCIKHDLVFTVNAGRHLRGQGCPLCKQAGRKIKAMQSIHSFIETCKSLHPGYDINEDNYTGKYANVSVWCRIHDHTFDITPSSLLLGNQGPCCVKEVNTQKKLQLGKESFLNGLTPEQVVSNDYSRVDYQGAAKPVEIICRTHNTAYHMAPYAHRRGQGCPKCGRMASIEKKSNIIRGPCSENKDRLWFEVMLLAKYGDQLVLPRDNPYVNVTTKVTVYCKSHGDFTSRPDRLTQSGCFKCGVIKSRNSVRQRIIDGLIVRFQDVHGPSAYGYDKVIYRDMKTKCQIYCHSHGGYFEQSPDSHLQGYGCRLCNNKKASNARRGTYAEWKHSLKLHRSDKGEVYDYTDSEQEFIDLSSPVTIYCKEHDNHFQQHPINHRNNAGCPKCAREITASKLSMTKETFVQRAQEVHREEGYGYDNVVLINTGVAVDIVCARHGSFYMTPERHLYGGGRCPVCTRDTQSQQMALTQEEFIKRMYAIYGDKFGFEEIRYKNTMTKVTIVCEEHGLVSCNAGGLLSGNGCWKCSGSTGERLISQYLDNLGLKHHREHRLPSYLFRYDFCLDDWRVLIEYHGQQHYQPVKYFGGELGYKQRKLNDDAKVTLARLHGYRLIVIPYLARERGVLFQTLVSELQIAQVSFIVPEVTTDNEYEVDV